MGRKAEKGTILVEGTVRGLVSEGEKIAASVSEFSPDVIALSISEEGMLAMVEHMGSDEEAGLDNFEEEVYAKALGRFGEVEKPPPSFVRAWELASEKGIPLKPVDFNDEEYTDLFCRHVSGVEWLRQPSKQRSLARKKFRSRSPEEFALEWDRIINGTKGMKNLELARENKISKEVNELTKQYSRVMLVVDYERSEGIRRILQDAGCRLE